MSNRARWAILGALLLFGALIAHSMLAVETRVLEAFGGLIEAFSNSPLMPF